MDEGSRNRSGALRIEGMIRADSQHAAAQRRCMAELRAAQAAQAARDAEAGLDTIQAVNDDLQEEFEHPLTAGRRLLTNTDAIAYGIARAGMSSELLRAGELLQNARAAFRAARERVVETTSFERLARQEVRVIERALARQAGRAKLAVLRARDAED